MSKPRNPQHTRNWRFLNDTPYRSKLTPEEKKFLDEFNSEHWDDRARDDAMEVAIPLGEHSIHWSAAPKLPSTKDKFSSLTPADIKMYLQNQKDKLSLRQLAQKLNMPHTTVKFKLKRVGDMLKELSLEELSAFLPDDVTEEDLKEALYNLER